MLELVMLSFYKDLVILFKKAFKKLKCHILAIIPYGAFMIIVNVAFSHIIVYKCITLSLNTKCEVFTSSPFLVPILLRDSG